VYRPKIGPKGIRKGVAEPGPPLGPIRPNFILESPTAFPTSVPDGIALKVPSGSALGGICKEEESPPFKHTPQERREELHYKEKPYLRSA
jgi:hypothetical protein